MATSLNAPKGIAFFLSISDIQHMPCTYPMGLNAPKGIAFFLSYIAPDDTVYARVKS